jgi:hypothetical protein
MRGPMYRASTTKSSAYRTSRAFANWGGAAGTVEGAVEVVQVDVSQERRKITPPSGVPCRGRVVRRCPRSSSSTTGHRSQLNEPQHRLVGNPPFELLQQAIQGNNSAAPEAPMHLRSEQATVVIDTMQEASFQ